MNVFAVKGLRVVVIGMGGIGGALARGFGDHGAHVAVADVDLARSQRVAADIVGAIVNLSSVRGRYGARFGQTEYSVCKGAIDSMTRSLAAQWAESGVRVNAVAPTFVETDLTRAALADETFAATLRGSIPMGRWAEAVDIVGPVLFPASPAAGFITGQIIYVDGGLTARI